MGRTVWDASTVESRLRGAGVPLARAGTATTPEAVAPLFKELDVGTVVLKAAGLVHKTNEGGVVLGLTSAAEAAEAARELLARIGDQALPFLLQEQRSGLEVLVGVRRDPELGAAIVVGHGGVETEVHRDVVHAVAPVSRADAAGMVRELRMWPLLEGFRGDQGRDVDALLDVIEAVSSLVVEDPSIIELDLNPVLLAPVGQGATVVDARVIADADPGSRSERPRSDLDRMMSPDHVAVVGVSDDPHKVGSRLFRYLVSHGYQGRLDPIHPAGGEINGRTRYRSLTEVPGSPDLVCVAVPARFVLDVAAEAIAKGAGGILVHSSDFAESGEEGRAAQEKLARMAADAGIPLMGPNCMGVVAPHLQLAASISGGLEDELVAGNVALVTSSGALGSCLASRLMGAGIGLSRWIHAGNEADRVIADYVEWLAQDPDTATVGLLLEDLKDGPRFVEAALKLEAAGKTVFAYSMARSDKGREAALSHTGAMVGSFVHREEVLRAAGVVSVPSLRTLEDALLLASTTKAPRGRRLMAVTLSGGACSIIADEAEVARISLPELSPQTQEAVAAYVPAYAAVRNPLDCSYQMLASPDGFERALDLLLANGEFDALLLQFTTNADPYAADLARAVINVRDRVEEPVYVSRFGGEQLAPKALAVYREAGVPVLDAPDRATAAVGAVMQAYNPVERGAGR